MRSVHSNLQSLLVLLTPCLCLGQGEFQSATATLQPSGEIQYQASYTFRPVPLEGPIVQGAPYSAQKMEDGSAATDEPRWLLNMYRDASGRTRIERSLPLSPNVKEPPLLVEIFDAPVGVCYVLDLQAKVAHRYRPPAPGAAPARTSLSQAVPLEATLSGAAKTRQPLTRIQQAEPAQVPKVATLEPTEPTRSENLGSQMIGGFMVEGMRQTVPIPSEDGVGRITSSEVWTSPELHLVVLSKTTNAQGGEHAMRLRNLTRKEPDRSLFVIPSGYRIQDEMGEFQITCNATAP